MQNNNINTVAFGDLSKEVLNFFKKRFNVIKVEDDNSVTFSNSEKAGFVPTKAEVEYVTALIEEGKSIESLTADRLERLGYKTAYSGALEDLNRCWDIILETPWSEKKDETKEKESKLLRILQKRVYDLRAIADVNDEYLRELRQEWMGKHPSTKNFDRYAEVMGLEPGSEEALHAQMLTPCKLIGKFVRSESSEAKNTKKEDNNEPNRDDWFNYDVLHRDGRTKDKDAENHANLAYERETKILDQFKWVTDFSETTIEDIGAELMMRFDALFTSDIVKQRIYSALGYDDEELYNKLMMTQDRIDEAARKGEERNEWREKVANGYIPSFDYDLYMLKFGRQKDISWPRMGGTFKSSWGAKLQFDCAPSKMTEEDRIICRNITCYTDGNKKEGKEPTIASYLGARDVMFNQNKIRSTKLPGYSEQLTKWNEALVENMIEQNPSFCIQVAKLKDKQLPEDKNGYSAAWYNALTNAIEHAERHVANRAEKIVIDHDYSSLEDVYGDEAEALALECLMAIRKQAVEAAEEQREYIGNRQVAGYVEEEECCEF